ncbi:MAG: histidine phosphatase family protein [Acidimicrobiales bacterium]
MTRIVLVRHGESACNVAGIVGGHNGCTGLTTTGVVQAEMLRDRLIATGELSHAEALYSSVLLRAVETARIIAPGVADANLRVEERCDLCELHPGEGDGLSWAKFTELYGEPDLDANPSSPVAPGGESWISFVERASGAVRSLAEMHAGGLVVVACHGGLVEATMLSFLPLSDRTRPLGLPTAYTSMTEWELDASRWRLLRYNDVAHLGGPTMAQSDGPHRAIRQAQQA